MTNQTDVVKRARGLIAGYQEGNVFVLSATQYDQIPELLTRLCDEVERLRMAVSHAIRRNHDYNPDACDGCGDGRKSLSAIEGE